MTDDERRKKILEEAKARAAGGTWHQPEPPERSPPVRNSDSVPDLVFKTNENALASAPADNKTHATSSRDEVYEHPWNQWLQRAIDERLDAERQIIMDAVVDIIGEILAKARVEYGGEQSAVNTATEFTKLWKSVTEAHKSIVELSRERAAQSFRELSADTTKKMN
jgi:hypothetical protein